MSRLILLSTVAVNLCFGGRPNGGVVLGGKGREKNVTPVKVRETSKGISPRVTVSSFTASRITTRGLTESRESQGTGLRSTVISASTKEAKVTVL